MSSCLSTLESRFPNCGLIALGDFNKLNISTLTYNYNMRQLVNLPTRSSSILDLALTNPYDFYDQPGRYALFGLSDHVCVILNPKVCSLLPKVQKKVIIKRDLRPSFRSAIRKYLKLLDIASALDQVRSCAEKTALLESIVKTSLNYIMPLHKSTVKSSEPPWMTSKLSKLIKNESKLSIKFILHPSNY